MKLVLMPERFAVCQPESAPPLSGRFVSVTRTEDELSVICEERFVPAGARQQAGWRMLRFVGKLPFTEIGVLASVLNPLRDAGVSILAVSTFDTDYVLVKDSVLDVVRSALAAAGHELLDD